MIGALAAVTPFLSSLIALATMKERIYLALIPGTAATIVGVWVIL